MCGIFGIIAKSGTEFQSKDIRKTLEKIAIFSESRGQDSSGIAFKNYKQKSISVIKGDIPINKLLKCKEFKEQISTSLKDIVTGFSAIGHARLVTNGSQLLEANNQPVIKDNSIVIHNGIIVNVEALWQKNKDLKRDYLIDTEIIPALLRKELSINPDIAASSNRVFNSLVGTFSIAMMFAEINTLLLSTNNGSLYYITDEKSYFIFASESYFLKKLLKTRSFKKIDSNPIIHQLIAGSSLFLNMVTFEINRCSFKESKEKYVVKNGELFEIKKYIVDSTKYRKEVVIDSSVYFNRNKEKHLFNLLENNVDTIAQLKRCTKCLLPETFPFIHYDHAGVCNLCNNYTQKNNVKPIEDFNQLIDKYRNKSGKPDCIVPFSGGRDSTYTLHIVKKVLGLNPIAFTYDWGMVTDLARRNIARVCGKLGVENIIVSADIHWKRENIRKNIQAWLRSPELGMIPLFMAGDKFFFYYCNQLKKQTGIDLNIWGINHLENTEFKSGYAGLSPNFGKKRIYSLSIIKQMRLFAYVAKNIVKSPGYLNQSVLDNLGSFASRYISPKKDYFHLFDYYRWDEKEIEDLLKNEYEWETAIDTKSTWRIGDGTASFYNYIYNTVAGFSENDTFRSNQIREGMLDRDTALKLCAEDNITRYETLRWYLEIVGLDFESTIKRINAIPKLY